MHKELLAHPHIASYSALLLAGLAGGYAITRWRAVRVGIRGAHIDNMMLLLTVASLFGARFFSWLFYFPRGSSLWDALTTSGGGMVFYGGLIFGAATVILYARVASLSLGNLLDVCAPGVALGLALGRVGCFLAGCCWGDLCISDATAARIPSSQVAWQVRTFPAISRAGFPLAVSFPRAAAAYEQHQELGLIGLEAGSSLPVHPVQLYEAGLALGLCVILNSRFRRRQWFGEITVALVLGYGAIRFGTEFMRADNSPLYAGLTLSQFISVLMAGVAVAVLISRHRVSPQVPTPIPLRAGE